MINLNEGSFFWINDNGPTKLASGILYADDFPISDKEEQSQWMMLDVKKDVGMSFDIKAIDLNLLDQIIKIPMSNKFTLMYEQPIMIQARWHKRHRINKKWLKRFGMKPDTVTVSYDAETWAYDVCDGSFDIDASSKKYNWKPHQKRRNLKIEW